MWWTKWSTLELVSYYKFIRSTQIIGQQCIHILVIPIFLVIKHLQAIEYLNKKFGEKNNWAEVSLGSGM